MLVLQYTNYSYITNHTFKNLLKSIKRSIIHDSVHYVMSQYV